MSYFSHVISSSCFPTIAKLVEDKLSAQEARVSKSFDLIQAVGDQVMDLAKVIKQEREPNKKQTKKKT